MKLLSNAIQPLTASSHLSNTLLHQNGRLAVLLGAVRGGLTEMIYRKCLHDTISNVASDPTD